MSNESQAAPLMVPLDDPRALDRAEVGAKAAVLARMKRAGFPVPDGCVFTAAAMSRQVATLETLGAQAVRDGELDSALRDTVREVAARLEGPLAVRSSGIDEDGAHASHAGQYTTVLNVEGRQALGEALRSCWASAFSAAVREYRSASGAEGESPLAVFVQRMVPARTAGVAFTANPVTGARDEVLVSAVPGIGEQLVSGEVSPDEWVVPAGGAGEPVNTDGRHGALTAEGAREVADLAERVAEVMGGPTDIEWAHDGERLHLLQARPITAIADAVPAAVPITVDPPQGFWAKDTTHAPVPLLPMTRELLDYNNAVLEDVCAEFGLLIKGQAFRTIGGWRYTGTVPLPPAEIPARMGVCAEALRNDRAGQAITTWLESERPGFAERIAALREVDVARLSDAELAEHVSTLRTLHRDGTEVHFRLLGAVSIALGRFGLYLTGGLGWDQSRVFELLAGLSTESTGPGLAMAELARKAAARLEGSPGLTELRALLEEDPEFAGAFESYRSEYGCRALQYELANPALGERPELILSLLRDQIVQDKDLGRTGTSAAETRGEAVAKARAELAGRDEADRFGKLLKGAELAYPVREDNEYWTVSAPNALLRWTMLEVARRLVTRGLLDATEHVFFLEVEEARRALEQDTDVRDRVTERRGEHRWALENPGPASYGERPGPPPPMDQLPAEVRETMGAFQWTMQHLAGTPTAPAESGSGRIGGVPGAAGRYTGVVRVVLSEDEFDKIRAGDVLVCPITSPVWSVVFPSIGALVTDTGGALSHAAIIAREYGIPAALATGNGTELLTDGMLVTVDGTTGSVEIHER
ncbi:MULTISPECIES: PEP/pyruvate-binding domain-containing protein [unclassified Streptomyces]|uniref:PEP/pyruvate-binding domain-containing protein n=1 Tax=unclassified Streptomyces TaxID=2593676 RepID=UPI0022B6FD3B|nr:MULTISPECIES: PEP/pyruvate-binding domain-containing protein [unclassified Streptomyces]MCZ7416005.1 PEP-utilizing enzyme [Streptomyces sp. WMMC897]MCZ7434188.1 PEP-utilizing enzyme [Streptomyces sp. WMMC1477]